MELHELKELAQKLNIKYHHLVGAERLENIIRKHCRQELNRPFWSVAQEHGYDVPQEDEATDEELSRESAESGEYTVESGESPEVEQNAMSNLPDGITEEEVKRLSQMTFAKVDARTKKQIDNAAYKHAMKLVRCTITCNNKNKSSYQGEIFSARNAKIPEVKKFIPFGVVTHVPEILLNVIKEKQYQVFRKERMPNGNIVTRSNLIPEYNIQIYPPITVEEFLAIKRKQLAEGEGVNNG